MATETGVVTKLKFDDAWVTTTRTSACEGCAAKGSCRTLGGGKEMEVEAINTAGARVGDTVIIAFETSSLLKISFLLYIVPVFGMIAGAVIGLKLALVYHYDESIFSAIFAFLFFFSSIPIIRLKGKKMAEKNEYRPKIIRILQRHKAV